MTKAVGKNGAIYIKKDGKPYNPKIKLCCWEIPCPHRYKKKP